jgi:hypothetical protein
MGQALLLSVVVVPVLLGVLAGRSRRLRSGLARLLVSVFVFDLIYVMFLYVLLRRWT